MCISKEAATPVITASLLYKGDPTLMVVHIEKHKKVKEVFYFLA